MAGETNNRAVIIGAGPGGLTAAIALQRVGIRVAVFERAAELRKAGAGLGVQSNALRALLKLGIGYLLENEGTELRVQEIRDQRGGLLFALPQGEVADQFGTPTLSLVRSDVQFAFVNALEEGVLHLDSECVGVEQDSDGVTAMFADGRSERGVVLIGADGGRSTVRKHVYGPDDPPPRYAGFTSWRAVVKMPPGFLPADTSRSYLGVGTQFVMFPVGEDRVYWGVMKRAAEGGEDPPEGIHRVLTGYLRAFPQASRDLVEATPEAEMIRTDIYDRDVRPTWVKGRVALLGDAAHMTTPFIGQGAGISMEDSVVLARQLALTDGLRDQRMLANALEGYQRARVPRCTHIVMTSRQRGEMFSWSNPAKVLVRNAVLRMTPARKWRKAVEETINYDV